MRKDILERKEEILQWIKEGQSKAFMCRQLRCKQDTLNSYLSKMGIEYRGNQGARGLKKAPNYVSAEEYSKRDFPSSHKMRLKLLKEGIKEEKCEYCGLSEWQGQKIPLELHHIDGNHFNNDFENLAIICPNCHAQQHGNSGANRGRYS